MNPSASGAFSRVVGGVNVTGGACAEGVDGRSPALKEVDAARVEHVGRAGTVEAAICSACVLGNAHGAREVGLALITVDP